MISENKMNSNDFSPLQKEREREERERERGRIYVRERRKSIGRENQIDRKRAGAKIRTHSSTNFSLQSIVMFNKKLNVL